MLAGRHGKILQGVRQRGQLRRLGRQFGTVPFTAVHKCRASRAIKATQGEVLGLRMSSSENGS